LLPAFTANRGDISSNTAAVNERQLSISVKLLNQFAASYSKILLPRAA